MSCPERIQSQAEPDWGAILGLIVVLASAFVTCSFLAAVVWLLGYVRVSVAALVVVGLLIMGWCFYELEKLP